MTTSRRDFLKLGLLTLSGLAFRPYYTRQEERDPGLVVRIASLKVDVYNEPDFESDIVGEMNLSSLQIDFPDEGISLFKLEKQIIQKAIEKAETNQTKAAKLLGISRDTLRYKIKKYNL